MIDLTEYRVPRQLTEALFLGMLLEDTKDKLPGPQWPDNGAKEFRTDLYPVMREKARIGFLLVTSVRRYQVAMTSYDKAYWITQDGGNDYFFRTLSAAMSARQQIIEEKGVLTNG